MNPHMLSSPADAAREAILLKPASVLSAQRLGIYLRARGEAASRIEAR